MFKELSINNEIRDKEVRLIAADGEQKGIVSIQNAMAAADVAGLDLVLIAPQSKPPVCKLMDYKKYRFDAIKREKEEKKKTTAETKEMRLGATIDVGDMDIKARKTREFLSEGSKVIVSLRMKGRQQTHPELSIAVMNDFFSRIADVAQMDKKPTTEGRNVTMVLSPISTKK